LCFATFDYQLRKAVRFKTTFVKALDVLHVSIEYFPAAKAGGLADVVGALPKYLNANKFKTAVAIPKHHTDWILKQKWDTVFNGKVKVGDQEFAFEISSHGAFSDHPLYVIDIPGLFDRKSIYIDTTTGYGYTDDHLRNIAFQMSVLEWIVSLRKFPKIIHCHDHHTDTRFQQYSLYTMVHTMEASLGKIWICFQDLIYKLKVY